MTTSIDSIIETLTRRGICTPRNVAGCSDQEIELIEKHVGKVLPGVYRQFLATLGKCAGRFFLGSDILFPEILNQSDYISELFDEDGFDRKTKVDGIPVEDFVVFAGHQGYQFLLIPSGLTDDPPVYRYVEGSCQLERIATSLSEFLTHSATFDSW